MLNCVFSKTAVGTYGDDEDEREEEEEREEEALWCAASQIDSSVIFIKNSFF